MGKTYEMFIDEIDESVNKEVFWKGHDIETLKNKHQHHKDEADKLYNVIPKNKDESEELGDLYSHHKRLANYYEKRVKESSKKKGWFGEAKVNTVSNRKRERVEVVFGPDENIANVRGVKSGYTYGVYSHDHKSALDHVKKHNREYESQMGHFD